MENTKKCPYCGEKIKAEAVKCRFCGEWLVAPAERDAMLADNHDGTDGNDAEAATDGNDMAETADSAQGTNANAPQTLRYDAGRSRTTNIPPRMPAGYSYTSADDAETDASASAGEHSARRRKALRSQRTVFKTKKKRPSSRRISPRASRSFFRRGGIWLLCGILLIAGGAACYYGFDYLNGSRKPADATVVADSLPDAPAAITDTMPVADPADSLRIQDSIARAARARYLQQQQAAEQEQSADTTAVQHSAPAEEAKPDAQSLPTDTL